MGSTCQWEEPLPRRTHGLVAAMVWPPMPASPGYTDTDLLQRGDKGGVVATVCNGTPVPSSPPQIGAHVASTMRRGHETMTRQENTCVYQHGYNIIIHRI